MWTLLYPSLPKNDAQANDAEPAPINAILVYETLLSRGGRLGSLICLTFMSLKTLQANYCSFPISMVPPSSQWALHVEAHS